MSSWARIRVNPRNYSHLEERIYIRQFGPERLNVHALEVIRGERRDGGFCCEFTMEL
jgi:hypothetical protein